MPKHLPAGILPRDLDWAAVEAMSQRFTLGIPVIDQQHRMLFAWYVALRRSPDALQFAEGLVTYAASHFAYEEHWAGGHGIDVSHHHAHHDRLLVRLGDLLQTADTMSCMTLAYDWLTMHIDVEDRALVAACEASG